MSFCFLEIYFALGTLKCRKRKGKTNHEAVVRMHASKNVKWKHSHTAHTRTKVLAFVVDGVSKGYSGANVKVLTMISYRVFRPYRMRMVLRLFLLPMCMPGVWCRSLCVRAIRDVDNERFQPSPANCTLTKKILGLLGKPTNILFSRLASSIFFQITNK